MDLSTCEHEPVHVPGAIQPHGILLVLEAETLAIASASDNAAPVLGIAPARAIGQALASLTSIRDCGELVENLARPDLEERNPLALTLQSGEVFDGIAHRHAGRLLLELEPQSSDPAFQTAYFQNRVRAAMVRLRGTSTLRELCEQMAREMRRLTGYDRVIVYVFQPDWSGEVIAEDAASGASYLGLRFPASDIPAQARALYASCRLRIVPTSTYEPSRLVGRVDAPPVDLTHAALRSISPFHLEYMRNMGVTASMGISLMRDDRLWGLITCNHESGHRFIPYVARSACALLGELVSSMIGPKERLQQSEEQVAFQNVQAKLLQLVAQDRDLARGLTMHSPSLLDVTGSQGTAVCHGDEIHGIGLTPPKAAIAALLSWLRARGNTSFVTQSLSREYPPAHEWKDSACGLVASAITVGAGSVVQRESWLLWFRPEVARTVEWGGDPKKPMEPNAEGALRPRTSFELWKEVVHLESAPFRPAELEAARSLATALVDVVIELEASRRLEENARLLEESHQALLRQIEENQKVEIELRRAQKLEAVGRLAAGIAHEINTPLQFVNDNLRFLERATHDILRLAASQLAVTGDANAAEEVDFEYLGEEVPKSIAQSLQGLKGVSAIVRAMKAFAHPDSAERELANINDAIATTVDVARGETKLVAEVTMALGELPLIPCYLGDLNQVFLNLIVNAAHAIAESRAATGGRGTIAIRSWQGDDDVFVSVTDDGAGIPEPIRESVFLPFFTTKEVGRGTGQGLAISHAIVVEKHGGGLDFVSEVGRGTTFTLRLPKSRRA